MYSWAADCSGERRVQTSTWQYGLLINLLFKTYWLVAVQALPSDVLVESGPFIVTPFQSDPKLDPTINLDYDPNNNNTTGISQSEVHVNDPNNITIHPFNDLNNITIYPFNDPNNITICPFNNPNNTTIHPFGNPNDIPFCPFDDANPLGLLYSFLPNIYSEPHLLHFLQLPIFQYDSLQIFNSPLIMYPTGNAFELIYPMIQMNLPLAEPRDMVYLSENYFRPMYLMTQMTLSLPKPQTGPLVSSSLVSVSSGAGTSHPLPPGTTLMPGNQIPKRIVAQRAASTGVRVEYLINFF